ncbi:MAG: ATP-binding protein [Thermoplasmata archaeon]
MEKYLSISSVPDFIIGSIKTAPGSFLIVGNRFTGKRELADIIASDLKNAGIDVVYESITAYGELYRFQAVNDLLNQATHTHKDRDKMQIIKEFEDFSLKSKRKIVFIVSDIDRVKEETRNLLLYVCRTANSHDISFIGTFSLDKTEASYNKFIDFIASESYINIIKLDKPTDSDISYIVQKLGYKLPDNFITDLNRITNSNIENIKYALRYYQTIGVINQNKEVNEVSFRYFPIPPTTEMYFESVISSLDKKQKSILYLLSVMGEKISLP